MRLRYILLLIFFVPLLAIFSISVYKGFETRRKAKIREEINRKIKVEVLNAAGVNGLARKVTWLLRKDGFDVVYYGNADEPLPKTVVVERRDSSMFHARHLAKWIGCREITLEIDPDRVLDVSLVLGKDYKKLFKGIDSLQIVF